MKRFLTVLASFVLAVSGFAQAPPKVQLALVLDQTGSAGGTGTIHRIDTRTGKYLGSFGQSTLYYPSAIAVQPTTNVVFVDDSVSLKKLDMSTGRYLGLVVRNTALGGPVVAMRFGPDGSLYAAVSVSGGNYDLVRVNPTTGVVVKSSFPQPTDYATRVTIGFRPNGNVTVFNSLGTRTYEDTYNAGSLAILSSPSVDGPDSVDFRTSNDVFLRRLSTTSVYSGVGAFSTGDFVGGANLTSPLIAEGALYQTFIFGGFAGNTAVVVYDTSDVAFLTGVFYPSPFTHGSLVDMAIYAK
jgi:hypothetical protein